MTIDLKLVQDTINYLETCPHGEVRVIMDRWMQTVSQPESKPEKEPDDRNDQS